MKANLQEKRLQGRGWPRAQGQGSRAGRAQGQSSRAGENLLGRANWFCVYNDPVFTGAGRARFPGLFHLVCELPAFPAFSEAELKTAIVEAD